MFDKSIIFMGTPDFAAESLKSLYEKGIHIKAVVTQPDKQRGRGRKVSYTPVKELALKYNIPVIQPENVKSNEFRDELISYSADLFVIVAFSVLPKKIINIPPLGSINLHASLLPDYRGAAPINHALFNGEKKTGVTVFFLNSGKVDSGDVLGQLEVDIAPDDNFESLYNKLKVMGSLYLVGQIERIFSGNFTTIKQNETKAKHLRAPKIFQEDFEINWQESSDRINNRIRGLAPKPGAFTNFKNKRLKIIKADIVLNQIFSGEPGEVVKVDKGEKCCYILTGEGVINLLEVQPEGKGKMDIASFINGYQLNEGLILG